MANVLAEGVHPPTPEQVDDYYVEHEEELEILIKPLMDLQDAKIMKAPYYGQLKEWFKENAPGMDSYKGSGKSILCKYMVAYAAMHSGKWTPPLFLGEHDIPKMLTKPDAPEIVPKCAHCDAALFKPDALFCVKCGRAQGAGNCWKCAVPQIAMHEYCFSCGAKAADAPNVSNGAVPMPNVAQNVQPQHVKTAITMLKQSNGNAEIINQVLATLQQRPRSPNEPVPRPNEPVPRHNYERCTSCQCTLVQGQPQCYQCGTRVSTMGTSSTQGAATERLPSHWMGADPMPSHQQGDPAPNLPKFLYNQQTKHIVDPEAPMEIPTCPSAYTPNPLLQSWKPAQGVYMHPAESGRLHSYQEIMAFLYAAIGQSETCVWPNPVEGRETKWSHLSHFGKALALVEATIARMALTREEGLTSQEANLELGIGSHAFTTSQRAAIGKRVGVHRKADKLLQATQSLFTTTKKGDQRQRDRGDKSDRYDRYDKSGTGAGGGGKEVQCWTCGKRGHVAAKCRSAAKPPQDKAAQEAAVKARLQQLTQAAAHAATHEKQGGDL